TIKIYLPVYKEAPEEESDQQASFAPWQGSGTVLLVDDEEHVIFVAKTMLEELGFSVIDASNGKEALELYRMNAEKITLVVTDIGMPVMDGYALFSELKKINPELPIIISSGFSDTVVTLRIAVENIAGFISKPYSFEQLRDALKSVVGSCH
ncbi:MAG: response regulator, partial [Chlorobiaceae bacterium]